MKSKYSENKEWQDYLKLYKERPELFLQSDQISIIFDENTINTFVEKTNKKIGVLYKSDFHILIVDLVSDELFLQSDQISIIFDENTINTFVEKTNKKIGVLYKSDFHILIVDLVSDKNKKLYTYERLLPSVNSGAVVTLPIQNKKLVLLKQYRHAIRQSQYCFPRGFGEVGLSAQQNAEKELKEELHAHITKTQYLGNIIADSGILSTQTAVFVCEVEDIQQQNAEKELKEELHAHITKTQYLGNIIADSGILSTQTAVFVCEVEDIHKEYGYEGIDDIVFLTPKELETWISNKKITDSLTRSAYSLYKFHSR